MDLLTLLHKNNKKYSQSGQDAFVINYFNNKRNGVFIDIGANDGISLSNTYYLEKELGWTGICFEPIPAIFEKLSKNRNCITINAGIADKKSIEKFTFVNGPSHMLSGITKEYDPRHLQRIQNEVKNLGGEIVEIDVQCVMLNDILEEHEIYNIDYLSLDTEGNEFNILKTIDFNKFNIRVMSVENNYNNIEQTNYITSNGYYFHGRLEADEIFARIKK
jgi:FkbM family methyltransferase